MDELQKRGYAVHELSIAQSLLDIVLAEGRKHQLEKVHTIKLEVGALAAVVPESLTFCFEMLSKDTIASGASLEIETVPVVARCDPCNIMFEVENYSFLCPECGEPTPNLISGRELSLMNIEGETGDTHDTDQDSSGAEYPAGQ